MSRRSRDLDARAQALFPMAVEPNPMVRRHGLAPGADICGSCRFLASYQYVRTYYKCRKRGDTSSAATDHRVGWRACALFEAKPC